MPTIGQWTDAASGSSTAQTPLRYDAQKQRQGHQLRLAAALFLSSAPEVLWEEIKTTSAVERWSEAMVAADELLSENPKAVRVSSEDMPGMPMVKSLLPASLAVIRTAGQKIIRALRKRAAATALTGPSSSPSQPKPIRCLRAWRPSLLLPWYCLYRPVRPQWIRPPLPGARGLRRWLSRRSRSHRLPRLDLRRRRGRSTRSPMRCSISPLVNVGRNLDIVDDPNLLHWSFGAPTATGRSRWVRGNDIGLIASAMEKTASECPGGAAQRDCFQLSCPVSYQGAKRDQALQDIKQAPSLPLLLGRTFWSTVRPECTGPRSSWPSSLLGSSAPTSTRSTRDWKV